MMLAGGKSATAKNGTAMAGPYAYVLDPDVSDNATLQDLVAHWQRKRGERRIPLRADIDPVELRKHVGSLVLIECLPEADDFRYRLIGTAITQAYGRDSTGKTVRELYTVSDPEYCEFLLGIYRTVVAQRCLARLSGSLRPVARDYRSFDSLLLPLDRGDGTVGWILNEVLFS
jgi:hypothetical protein